MFEIIKEEKKRLNPIRRKINYIITPIYCAVCLAFLVPTICLMTIDDKKYLPVFLAFIGVFVLLTAAMLISIPFVRKKEVAIELPKYDLDIESAEPRDEYIFTQSNIVATFPISSSPFDEFKNDNAMFKGTDGLKDLIDYYGVNLISGKTQKSYSEFGAINVGDVTDNALYTNFYAKAQDGKLEIYSSYTVVINESGISVNGVQFDLENAHVGIIAYNLLNQVHIFLNFLFKNDLSVSLRLSKDVLAIINKFSIKVENRKLLDFILNYKAVAFEEILKCGRITEKTLN